jgi:hypothetical protein
MTTEGTPTMVCMSETDTDAAIRAVGRSGLRTDPDDDDASLIWA